MKQDKTVTVLSIMGGILVCGVLLSAASAIYSDRYFSKKFRKR